MERALGIDVLAEGIGPDRSSHLGRRCGIAQPRSSRSCSANGNQQPVFKTEVEDLDEIPAAKKSRKSGIALKTASKSEELFVCELCSKSFTSGVEFDRHVRQTHDAPAERHVNTITSCFAAVPTIRCFMSEWPQCRVEMAILTRFPILVDRINK